jgi:hypothetical protein
MEDERLPVFNGSYYSGELVVCFKLQETQRRNGETTVWPSNYVLLEDSEVTRYKKPKGLKVFREDETFEDWVESRFHYGR